MTEKQILKKLKNDDEYYNGIGKNYLSNSNIQALTTEPRQFQAPQKDGEAFVKGRYFHQLILEPEKASVVQAVDTFSRNTKIYKDAVLASEETFLLLNKERDEIESLVATMMGNIDFFDAIRAEGNTYEEPSVGMIKDRMWKGKADIITNDIIIDLKTTSSIKDFKYSAKKYNYDSQCYIYQT